MNNTRLILSAILVFMLGYLALSWARPLVIPDEARYAVIPAEMLMRGDLVVPRLLGIEYFEKPVGGYWLVAGAMTVFGENAFAYRLPAIISTGLTALLLGVFVRFATRRTDLGALSSMVYLTMFMVYLIGTSNILDAPFAAMVTGSMVFAFMGMEAESRRGRISSLVFAGAFCGAAFLIKGFLAVVLPALVVGPYLLWNRRWMAMVLVPWIPLIVAGVVILPWAIVVHRDAPGFWHEFFWVEHVQRFTAPDGNQHDEPFWFFLPVVLVAGMPWLLAAPASVRGWSSTDLGSNWFRFMVCWFVMPFLFLSASSGKLPTYILPIIPPFAAFLLIGLMRRFEACSRPFRKSDLVPGALLILAGLAILIEWPMGNLELEPWGPGGDWRYLLLASALAWWGLLDWVAVRTTQPQKRVLFMALSPLMILATIPVLFPTGLVSERKAPMAFLAAHRSHLAEAPVLYSNNHFAHAVGLDTARMDLLILGDPSEFDTGRGKPEEEARLVTFQEFQTELAKEGREPFMLVTDKAGMSNLVDSGVREPDEKIEGSRVVIATWD